MTIALESDVEQSVVRGDALFWKWLVEKRHNNVVAVDGRVHSSIPEVDTKPEDWEETIWGTDPSDPEVFMYVASILMDVAPVAGTVKSVVELFTGRDLITNEEIPLWLAAGGVIGSFVPGGKGAVKGVAKVLKGVDYRKIFFKANPELKGKVVVHHAIEQQVFRRYPNLFKIEEIHSLENLRGIPKDLNPRLHLSTIRKEWNKFYKINPNPSKQTLIDEAKRIDELFGHLFIPKK